MDYETERVLSEAIEEATCIGCHQDYKEEGSDYCKRCQEDPFWHEL